jgi:hypothetical protein
LTTTSLPISGPRQISSTATLAQVLFPEVSTTVPTKTISAVASDS